MEDKINSDDTNGQQPEDRKVNLGRHKAQCSICKHPQCGEIEEAYLDWTSPAKIKFDFGVSRDALRRHCIAFNLRSRRLRNLVPAYEGIVERADTVKLTGSNIISALRDLSKLINAVWTTADAAQSADEKPAAQEETARESNNGPLVGSIAEMLDKISGAEPGKSQSGSVEAQSPQNPPLQ